VTRNAKVSVTSEGEGRFRVDVRSREATTTHIVAVPEGLARQLGCPEVCEEELVLESFDFLLEREPPTSILRHFSLDVISRYFPEYPTEISRRFRN
jgi:hypothetical protein